MLSSVGPHRGVATRPCAGEQSALCSSAPLRCCPANPSWWSGLVSGPARASVSPGGGRRGDLLSTMAIMRSSSTTTLKPTTVERRAADVAVLGNSSVALAAALALARRGKKVVLLPNLGLTAQQPPPEVLRPLQLTHPDPGMVSLTAEAAAYWRGLQVQAEGSGVRLFADCRSLDLGMVRGGGMASELLGRMQDAAKVAGVRLGSLGHEELSALFPSLRPAGGTTGLLQPEGGVLNSAAAHSMLLSLCERNGVLVRERLLLRGWRDAGAYFVLRASGSLLPDVESLFEVEQLLLAPDSYCPEQALRMFGVEADLQVSHVGFNRCAAATELSALPLWRSLSMAGGTGDNAAPVLQAVTGYPARISSSGDLTSAMKLALGLLPPSGAPGSFIADPWTWRPDPASNSAELEAAHRIASRLVRGVGPVLQRREEDSASGSSSPPRVAGVGLHVTTPDGWPAVGFLPGVEAGRAVFVTTASSWFQGEDRERPSEGGSGGSGGSGSSGSRSRETYDRTNGSSNSDRNSRSSSDSGGGGAQRPGVDSRDPREVAAAASSRQPPARDPSSPSDDRLSITASELSSTLGGRRLLSDGYALSPLLAKMAADLLCGAAQVMEADPERLDLGRSSLHAVARSQELESWEGLGRWQNGEAFQNVGEGVDVDEARDRAEALAKGARMMGTDAGLDDSGLEAEERRRGPKKMTFV